MISLLIGIWIGMLIGISFVEAPLKFQAPGVTLEIGLAIGRLVFSALNKAEIIFSTILLFWIIRENSTLSFWAILALGIPILSSRVDQ